MRRVIIEVDDEANVTVKVEGQGGKSCTDLTKGIEAALGSTKRDTKTSEFYQVAPATQKARA